MSETGHLLNLRLQEHKAITKIEGKKSGIADYIWSEKGTYYPFWD